MKLNKFEKFALDFYLSDYPIDTDYDTILQMISDNDELIIVFNIIENQTPDNIIESIEDLKFSVINLSLGE